MFQMEIEEKCFFFVIKNEYDQISLQLNGFVFGYTRKILYIQIIIR